MTAKQRAKVAKRKSTQRKPLKLEFGIPPIMPEFQCTPLPLFNADHLIDPKQTDISMPLFMSLPTQTPKLEVGNMGGLQFPFPPAIPPLMQGQPMFPHEFSWTDTAIHLKGTTHITKTTTWPVLPKIKITNKKTKRGRKKQKAEVLMFNPNLFPSVCGMKDEFGFLNFGEQFLIKKNPQPKPLTMKEQRLRDTGSYVQVWRGNKKYTKGGLTKKDLVKNKKGRVVSKRQQEHNPLKKWVVACRQAKLELKIPGFCPLNKGPNGKALYKRAKEIYAEIKAKEAKAKQLKKENVDPKKEPKEENKENVDHSAGEAAKTADKSAKTADKSADESSTKVPLKEIVNTNEVQNSL